MANDAPRHAPPANVSEPPSDQRDSEFGIGKVWPFLSFFLTMHSVQGRVHFNLGFDGRMKLKRSERASDLHHIFA